MGYYLVITFWCWYDYSIFAWAEAQAINSQAEEAYNDGSKNILSGTHDSHIYWATIKSALFDVDMTIPPLVKVKVDSLATVCDSKHSRVNYNLRSV